MPSNHVFWGYTPIEPSDNDNYNNNEGTTLFVENILGSEFKDCVSSLPLVKTPIEIEVGTRFYSMPIAVHFIEQYALQNSFAVLPNEYLRND